MLLSLIALAAYLLLRRNVAAMEWTCAHFTRPYHRAAAAVCEAAPFSVAGVLIALGVIAAAVYIVLAVVRIIRHPGRGAAVYRLFMTVLCVFLVIYSGFCLLWGVYYYTADFEEQSGLTAGPVSTQQLEAVTKYFARLANEYGEQMRRDGSGVFCEDMDAVFGLSPSLYREAEAVFPCLSGPECRAKPFMFSKIMSYLDFTGFFFPFTGEASINTDSPACFIPSTIAHELAHQRGVAAEDEANFAAVLACLENGDPIYCYSACLLAYTHLGNALYSADYDAWCTVYSSLSDGVRADLAANNAYWAGFKTPVSGISNSVYTGFLHSYGQALGLRSYGACVDLLVAYYYDISVKE